MRIGWCHSDGNAAQPLARFGLDSARAAELMAATDAGRHVPGSGRCPYDAFYSASTRAGYDGRLAVESSPTAAAGQADSLHFLRTAWDGVGGAA